MWPISIRAVGPRDRGFPCSSLTPARPQAAREFFYRWQDFADRDRSACQDCPD